MDLISCSFNNKIQKIETLLLELNKEIAITVKYLLNLKEHSAELVERLTSLKSNYFKEFLDVHSFLLNYSSFLTEVNCKFEMMNMLGSNFKSQGENLNSNMDTPNNLTSNSNDGSFDWSQNVKLTKEKQSSKSKFISPTLNNNNLLFCPSKKTNLIEQNFFSDLESNTKLSEQSHGDGSSSCSQAINANKEALSFDNDFKSFKIKSDDIESHNSKTQSLSSINDDKKGKNFFSKSDIEINAVSDVNSLITLNEIKKRDLHFDYSRQPMHWLGLGKKDKEDCSSYNLDKLCKKYEEMEYCVINQDKNIKETDIASLWKSKCKVGEKFLVTIEHIKTPSEFYIQIKNHKLDLLDELESKLKLITPNIQKQLFLKNENKKSMSKEIGMYSLYYSKCDETWYRAKVTNWCTEYDDNFVNIFLIDYGESKCVPFETLIPMPENFKRYPAFAQKCSLYGLYPTRMKGSEEILSWGRESTEKMKSLIENSNSILVEVAPDDESYFSKSMSVIVWLEGNSKESLNELLVKNKCAVCDVLESKYQDSFKMKLKSVENELQDKILENWNPMKEDFESYQNNYDLNINDPAAVIYGYVGRDYDRICLRYAKTGHCYKGETCKKEHKLLDPLGYTTDQEEVYKNAFDSLFVSKKLFNVQVTCLLSVNQFCCIKANSHDDHEEETLSSLLEYMNKQENIQQMKKLLIPPSLGQIVIAQYSEDDSWYRAKVVESQPESDVYLVLYVDYGNREEIPLSRIRAIEPRYLHLPFQALHCNIFGIQKNPQASFKDSLVYLNDKMTKNQVNIKVISQLPGSLTNLLVEVFDQNGRNIGEDLVNEGYAIRKDEIILSDDCENVPG